MLSIEAPAQQGVAPQAEVWEEEYSWILARRNGSPEAYQWFLDRYPSSRHRETASRRVVEAIVAGSAAAAPIPEESRRPLEGAFADQLDPSPGTKLR